MLRILKELTILDREIEISRIRSQGSGGQNVNKVSTGIHLRVNIKASSLADNYKARLLKFKDGRITAGGIILIKSQRFRSSERNRKNALQNLLILIEKATFSPSERCFTRPTRESQVRRINSKKIRGRIKAMRGRIMEQ
ncbi:MAG: Peptidyl-tRNA hydrolase ArfB [Candidatus Moanabacter tarae]|mgnify:CR=1 FL=1|uniref:Peptidyl-tRNA hydrolase ArfB n=1 Tax=Candidatus Moanibacter tarae TaxID=2200854 RepID=A0A2Z4ACD7_9BACT|nr:MAG: Peptidyl-tRNA hydrolase ArfB [Candidatus Moanabacter tarae]|tara:strand:- start:12769 stop:13185 length:417 start_codon:yes stop_codon:yes gene_type:complete